MKKLSFLLSVLLSGSAWAEGIATAQPLATQAGAQILRAGGNAFDAAVAITAALAVVEPYSSGLGGGGFYLIFDARQERFVFIDARERAPLAAHRDMYLDKDGQIIPRISIDGALSAGIPGIPAALGHLSQHYGSLGLDSLLEPARKLARDGFPVDRIYHAMARWRHEVLQSFPSSRSVYLKNGKVPDIGESVVQADLARTLELLARKGVSEFYRGSIAREMLRAVRANEGIWTKRDLADYRVIERKPIQISMAAGTLYCAPPPSSAGVALAQIFGQLDNLGLSEKFDSADPQHLHLLIEAMRRAYRDRAVYLGDADYVDVPIARLTDPNYAAGLAAGIHPQKATKSQWLSGQSSETYSPHTTHFSVYDKEGNMVSATLSINYPFGSGMIAGSTGVLLNDEMDDFSAKPGTQNVYGLTGGEANAIAPGKRMLSSMSPVILQLPERTVILGTPGGSRIITMVAQGVLSAIAGNDAGTIVNRARIHHQFIPDVVVYEPEALSGATQTVLQEMGHELRAGNDFWGNMQVVVVASDGTVSAASDRRGIGQAWTKADEREANQ